eukprot:TRINITY_DN5641_c0_g1_i1.p1 TRINITY_DN5641_c0_g1~~TRINITY_DN5641_c0_g1_i1.p1  ORF type:complete len:101 (+),score=22.82 TRINITY_DN5641_c0_g1_i1:2-304(+)
MTTITGSTLFVYSLLHKIISFTIVFLIFFFFFFKQKTAYEMLRSLVGSEMCIRDRWCFGDVLHAFIARDKENPQTANRDHSSELWRDRRDGRWKTGEAFG